MSKLIAEIDVPRRLRRRSGPVMEDPLGSAARSSTSGRFNWKRGARASRPEGGEGGPTRTSSRELDQRHRRDDHGAQDVQRRLGPWDADENANGWWGEEPPYAHPVFVLTHHEREPRNGRDDVHLRHRRTRVGAGAGARGGRATRRPRRRRRRGDPAVPRARRAGRRSGSTSRPSFSAAADACSTARPRTWRASSSAPGRWNRPQASSHAFYKPVG